MSDMTTLYWFCPENDLALAHGGAHFTPPRHAVALGREAAAIVWWLAGPGDAVLMPSEADESERQIWHRWLQRMADATGLPPESLPRLVTTAEEFADTAIGNKGADRSSPYPSIPQKAVRPWGWSLYTVEQLRKRGVSDTLLPTAGQIETLRSLSHRRITSAINRRLVAMVDFESMGSQRPEIPVEAATMAEAEEALRLWDGRVFVKAPWSSSGRGVADSRDYSNPKSLRQRIVSTIHAQGSCMIEPAYDKAIDFAMLFEARGDGEVKAQGWSEFSTVRQSVYTGNRLATDNEIVADITRYVGPSLLQAVGSALEQILTEIIGGKYVGPLGIDMMADTNRLVPCVELNLRPTMGTVARRVRQMLGADYRRMRVVNTKKEGCPATSLDLVPPVGDFRIIAVK